MLKSERFIRFEEKSEYWGYVKQQVSLLHNFLESLITNVHFESKVGVNFKAFSEFS